MQTETAPAAIDTTPTIEAFMDDLLSGGPAWMDMPGVNVGSWYVREQSVADTLAAITSAAEKLRRKVPGIVEHVHVEAVTERGGADPIWCETHRVFGCTYGSTPWETGPRCYRAPCPAAHIAVSVEGLPLYDGDWRVAGVLQRDSNGVVTAHSVGSDDTGTALAHRDLAGQCAHCHRKIARNTTVLLANAETGEVRPVGKSCLADYTGNAMRPEILATLTGLAERFNVEIGGVMAQVGDSAPLVDVVALATRYVARLGFVRSTDYTSVPTAQRVREGIMADEKVTPAPMITVSDLTEADRAAARDAIAMLLDTSADTDADRGSEYLANLRAVCSVEWVEVTGKRNKVGLLASLPGAAQRRAEFLARAAARTEQRAAEAADRVNAWIGEEGQRREFTGKVVTSMTIETEWGAKDLLVVDTSEGQVKAFGSIKGREEVSRDDTVTFVATIKGHTVRQGVEQTEVIRVKLP